MGAGPNEGAARQAAGAANRPADSEVDSLDSAKTLRADAGRPVPTTTLASPSSERTTVARAKAIALAATELGSGKDGASFGSIEPSTRPRTRMSPSSHPAEVNVEPAPLEEQGFGARYDKKALIGEGGMGEVRLCKDRRIGRDVAMKVIREGSGSHSDTRIRFEREARVQGQLEHPSIVPVYDLGIGPDGAAFFTMKRIRGKTLEEVIVGLRANDEAICSGFGRRRLLTAFGNVCLAVAFAHARGVLHRDLKPANVMLGDYGELYILDWGLAKINGTVDLEGECIEEQEASPEQKTLAGSIMGTPGYMAPEQIRGDIESLDERTDVYALGVMLFELLTLESLHPRTSANAIYASTLKGVDARPSVRAPHVGVPPELEAICVRATALDPEDRFENAREVHDAIEGFLDGDRDLEQRVAMADRHVAEAARFIGLAEGAADAAADREHALQEVSAALALVPQHPEAIATMMRLLLEAPAEMPEEARAEFEQAMQAADRKAKRVTWGAYFWYAAMMPFLLLLGVRNWKMFAVGSAVALTTPIVAYAVSRRPSFDGSRQLIVYAVSTVAISCASFFMGPFVFVGSMSAANTLAFVLFGRRKERPFVIAGGVLAIVVPFALELASILPRSYEFGPNGMTVLPNITGFPEIPTLLFLLVANVLMVIAPTVVLARVRDSLNASEERLFIHSWKLRQLVPDAARKAHTLPVEPEAGDICHASTHANWLHKKRVFQRKPAR